MPPSPRPEARSSADVVVTGAGALASIGGDLDAFWGAIAAGRDGIRPAARFATPELAAHFAATLPGERWRARLTARPQEEGLDPCAELAIAAAREALRRAGLEAPAFAGIPPHRIAIALGTSTGGLFSRSGYEFTPPEDRVRRHRLLAKSGFHVSTAAVADALGLSGPRLTLSTACTSSAHAIAHARDLVAAGHADVALAGGADLIVEEVLAGFHAMDAVCPAPCAPFSEPIGMTVGEGAGFLVLETAERARARGAAPLAVLLGYGLSADAHHATAPDPTGAGTARAARSALADAGLAPEDVGYVNAHGTGTEANDAAEWRALASVFGERAARLPVSSTKSYLGHTLGAAGVLELIATILSLHRQVVPPTLHFTVPRGGGPPDPVAEAAPRPHAYRIAMSCNAAFGGANAALVVGAADHAADRAASHVAAARASRPPPAGVVLLGAAALAAHGMEGLDGALRAEAPRWTRVDPGRAPVPLPAAAALVPPFPLERVVRGVDARGLDTLSRYLLAAAALSLQHAGVRVRGALRDRAGLFAGASRLPWDSADAFWDSLRERGFARASAPAFARIVMNAPAGAVSRALALRGPTSLFATGPGSALVAVAHAAEALARRDDADVIVAGAAHEIGGGFLADHAFRFGPGAGDRAADADGNGDVDWKRPFPVYGAAEERPIPGEGAACFTLARAPFAEAADLRPLARIAGWGLSGPEGLDEAIRQALAGAAPEEVDAIYGAADGRAASGAREVAALRAVFGARLAAVPLCNPAPVLGSSEALEAISLAAAVEALRVGRAHPVAGGEVPGLNLTGESRGPVRTVLVMAADEAGGSAAVLLRAEGG